MTPSKALEKKQEVVQKQSQNAQELSPKNLWKEGLKNLNKKDYKTAFLQFSEAASKGYSNAQFELGNMYYDGKEIPKNISLAFDYYEKAAKTENTFALKKLKELSENGVTQAKEIFEKYALRFNSQKEDKPHSLYDSSNKSEPKNKKAENHIQLLNKYEKAAINGNEEALQKLVELAKNDNANALQILENLAQSNRNDIRFALGEIYSDKGDFDKACDWYKKSAWQGNKEALQKLVELAKKSNANALKILENLPQSNRSDIRFALGEIYSDKGDFDKACDWYEKSAKQGNKEALQKLVKLAKNDNVKALKNLENLAKSNVNLCNDMKILIQRILEERIYKEYEKARIQENRKARAQDMIKKITEQKNDSKAKDALSNMYWKNSIEQKNLSKLKNNEIAMNFANISKETLQIIELIKSMILTEISPRYIYTVSYIETYFLNSYKMNIENMLTKDLLVQTCRELAQESKIYYLVEAEEKSLVLYKVDSFSDWREYGLGTVYIPTISVNDKKIDIRNFVLHVYDSLLNVKHNRTQHNVESVTIKALKAQGTLITFNAFYCHSCNEYYTTRENIEKNFTLNRYPLIRFNFHFRQAYARREESELMMYGYTVKEGELSANQRQNLLARLITFGFLNKSYITGFIKYLINNNGRRANMKSAVEKWQSDLEFVQNFNIGTQRTVYVEDMKIKYRGSYVNKEILNNNYTSYQSKTIDDIMYERAKESGWEL